MSRTWEKIFDLLVLSMNGIARKYAEIPMNVKIAERKPTVETLFTKLSR
tara:strand:+ start:1460 stop:1606 length:147 start_codon:yes stop_codon:yes gene_type:complete